MKDSILVVVSAFPGCGKTVTSSFLGRCLDVRLVSMSDIRKELGWMPVGRVHGRSEKAEQEKAFRELSPIATSIFKVIISERLKRGINTIIEGVFNRRSHRQYLYEFVSSGLAEELVIIRCECDIKINIARIDHRRVLKELSWISEKSVEQRDVLKKYREEYESIHDDPEVNTRGVSLVEYRTDTHTIEPKSGCNPGTAGAQILELLQELSKTQNE